MQKQYFQLHTSLLLYVELLLQIYACKSHFYTLTWAVCLDSSPTYILGNTLDAHKRWAHCTRPCSKTMRSIDFTFARRFITNHNNSTLLGFTSEMRYGLENRWGRSLRVRGFPKRFRACAQERARGRQFLEIKSSCKAYWSESSNRVAQNSAIVSYLE